MRIGVVQTMPRFGERERNLREAFELMSAHEADLWVLPEFFSTGYQFITAQEVGNLAESIPAGPTTQALQQYCAQHRCFAVGGVPEIDGGTPYNAAVLVGPDGYRSTYRKVHLFGKEKTWFAPGNRPFQVDDIGGCRVGMMICFDHLFPESARSLALLGADLLAHPSNLILPDLAQRTMAVRALENGVFAVTANRVGEEARGETTLRYTGQSQVVSPRGELLVHLSPDRVQVAVVTIDVRQARDKRLTSANDKLDDRRPEMYVLDSKRRPSRKEANP